MCVTRCKAHCNSCPFSSWGKFEQKRLESCRSLEFSLLKLVRRLYVCKCGHQLAGNSTLIQIANKLSLPICSVLSCRSKSQLGSCKLYDPPLPWKSYNLHLCKLYDPPFQGLFDSKHKIHQ